MLAALACSRTLAADRQIRRFLLDLTIQRKRLVIY